MFKTYFSFTGKPPFLLIHDGKNMLDRQQMQKIIDLLYTDKK